MKFFVHLALLPVVTNLVTCESTKAPTKEVDSKSTTSTPTKHTSTSEYTSRNSQSVWMYQPSSKQPVQVHDNLRYQLLLRQPHSLTKLAKALSLGFDPSFSKDYFEPFERRPRPVTLVAFRKNGAVPRYRPQIFKHDGSTSSEVAELQSPYNEISSFWHEDPGES